MEIIRTNLATKRFNTTTAIDNISIHVQKGEIYGFLGLNGAGKTTLIRMLLGMIKPSSGSVSVFGQPVTPEFSLWNNIGYLVETPHSYPNLSVKENLQVYYALRNLKTPSLLTSCLESLKLSANKDTKAKNLSLGNQQRLGLAKALIHRPELLILDEPINGLDPEGIVEVRDLLRNLASAGATVFLSSHILGEISKVATRIGIIHGGKLIKELAIEELSSQLVKTLRVTTLDNDQAITHLKKRRHDVRMNEANEIEVLDEKAMAHPESIAEYLVNCGLPPKEVYLFTEDLEMYFLRTIRSNSA
jgi:ABC-2 type transport system ATP-binding protein